MNILKTNSLLVRWCVVSMPMRLVNNKAVFRLDLGRLCVKWGKCP